MITICCTMYNKKNMYGGRLVVCHHSFYSGALELTIDSYKISNPREGFGERGDKLEVISPQWSRVGGETPPSFPQAPPRAWGWQRQRLMPTSFLMQNYAYKKKPLRQTLINGTLAGPLPLLAQHLCHMGSGFPKQVN